MMPRQKSKRQVDFSQKDPSVLKVLYRNGYSYMNLGKSEFEDPTDLF
jgi:hypothetical protein